MGFSFSRGLAELNIKWADDIMIMGDNTEPIVPPSEIFFFFFFWFFHRQNSETARYRQYIFSSYPEPFVIYSPSAFTVTDPHSSVLAIRTRRSSSQWRLTHHWKQLLVLSHLHVYNSVPRSFFFTQNRDRLSPSLTENLLHPSASCAPRETLIPRFYLFFV